MDDGASHPQEFVYNSIELYKSESLGSGSYGAVCKAKCDGLLCAAKIMHPVLFDIHDPGTATYLSKFQEECHLLSLARHPNIVQYLGTYHDRDTQLPVILMELCEESLTAFLDRSPGPLSYHFQVDICHDIALALVYLHSNGLIHRDLTGNNVLMIAGPRAKITDFGMSKLASMNPNTTALTKCPGNVLYMSPEALDEAKSYTAKLDIFSLGVIIIQILTRKFPSPTDRFCLVTVPQFDEPLRQVVSETERRQAHIVLIPDNHSLKPLALQCLKKKEVERPSALELGAQLSELKQSTQYRERDSETLPNTEIQQLKLQLRGQRVLTEAKIRDVECHINQKAELERLLKDKDKQLREKDKKLQTMCLVVHTKSTQLQMKERELVAKEKEHQTLVHLKNIQLQEKEREIQEMQRTIANRDKLLAHKEMELKQTREQLLDSQSVSELPQELKYEEKIMANLQEVIPGHEHTDLPQQQQGTTPRSDVTHTEPGNKDAFSMSWREGSHAPEAMVRGAATVYCNTAYFRPADSAKAYAYQNTTGEEKWSQLPDNPNKDCGLVVIDGLVTTVGGLNGSYTNKLLSLKVDDQRKDWTEKFPPMPSPRYGVACVTTADKLVVAGGLKGVLDKLDTVEVMSIESKQWTTVAPLPQVCSNFTATVCGDVLYLAGGIIKSVISKSVFTCSLSHLVGSISPSPVPAANCVWREISSLPFIRSTLVSIDGNLLAIGGEDDSAKPSSDVYRYNANTDSWTVDSQMKNKRSACLAIHFPEDRVIVVGGYAANTSDVYGSKIDSVELCTLQIP